MLITSFNPELADAEKSYLSSPYSAGVTTIVVKNADRFATNDRILVADMGLENAEIVTVQSIAADNQTITLAGATPTEYAHSADEGVYKLRFDQVKFYRSTTGVDGSYSVLATVALDVDNENLCTIYDDSTGLSSYYYKITFYHSIAALESAYSDPIQGIGWRRRQVGYIVDQMLQEVGDLQETHVTRNELLGYFNDVNDDLISNVSKPFDFLHTRAALTRTTGRNYLDFPVDSSGDETMWKFDYMDYNYTDSTTSPATDETSTIPVISEPEFRNKYTDNTISTTTESDAKPTNMCLDTSVNRFRFSHPALTTLANVFYLHYWKFFDVIDSEGDVIETPTPRIYKLYLKEMYWRKRAVQDPKLLPMADSYRAQYLAERAKYKGIDRKDSGTPRGFRPRTSPYKDYRR
jgi:hypothetical protein